MVSNSWDGPIERIDDFTVRIPRSYRDTMLSDGYVLADEQMLSSIRADRALEQVANVAELKGILGPSWAMPDIHWGYGFPIGGVAAFDLEDGIVSPGGVGYDINCGVRVIATPFVAEDINAHRKDLARALNKRVPSGVGREGPIELQGSAMEAVLGTGVNWALDSGYAIDGDQDCAEEGGCMDTADPDRVSDKARRRGRRQVGTLGAGNHFMEVQRVAEIFDSEAAERMGLSKDSVAIMLHSGSRGLGHQVATDHLQIINRYFQKTGSGRWYSARDALSIADRQLACVSAVSDVAEDYLAAMRSAANFAWCNRQVMTFNIREAFREILGVDHEDMPLVYDVCHNMAKVEEHDFEGRRRTVVVHRKGATRAFGPGHDQVPTRYRDMGQPVLIPGDMGTCSYILRGREGAMERTFGSACHGAGRIMSRTAAKKRFNADVLVDELARDGITVRAQSRKLLPEEAPGAYKDVSQVVDIVHGAGIASKVVQLRPMIVVKG